MIFSWNDFENVENLLLFWIIKPKSVFNLLRVKASTILIIFVSKLVYRYFYGWKLWSMDKGVFGAPSFKCYKEFTKKLYFPRSLWKLKLKGYPTNRILNLLSKVIFAVCYRLYYFDSLKVVKFVRKTVPGKTMEYLQKSSKKLVMYFRDPHWREHLKRMESYDASSL